MFTKEEEKRQKSWIIAVFAAVALGLFFLTGCGGSTHSWSSAPAEVDPCEATPIDLVVGFGDYDLAVYLDCEEDELELWLHEDSEIEIVTGFWDELMPGRPIWYDVSAFGDVIGSRSFELSWIEVFYCGWSIGEYEASGLITLCNDLMAISDFECEALYLACETATFWELRFENGVGELEGVEGPFESGVLFGPIPTE